VIPAYAPDPNLGTVTVAASFQSDPCDNSGYWYIWEGPVRPETGKCLTLVEGGGVDDPTATFSALEGSDVVATGYLSVCTIIGRDTGNSVSKALQIEVQSGIAAAHWWKLDETDGTVAHDSMGDCDGAVHGAMWTDGIVHGALEFNGGDDYVDCGDKALLAPERLTIAFWLSTTIIYFYCLISFSFFNP
jgi:hypothetical protein